MELHFIILKDIYAICKCNRDTSLSTMFFPADFYSVARTKDELSIVCKQSDVPENVNDINKDWKILQIADPLDFSLVGIIADITTILKKNNLPVFTISTFTTDYFLVKDHHLNKATEALKSYGHTITFEK